MMMMATIASFFPPSFACNEVFLHDPLLPLEHPHDQKEITLRESPPILPRHSTIGGFLGCCLIPLPLFVALILEHGVSLFFPTALFPSFRPSPTSVSLTLTHRKNDGRNAAAPIIFFFPPFFCGKTDGSGGRLIRFRHQGGRDRFESGREEEGPLLSLASIGKQRNRLLDKRLFLSQQKKGVSW